MITPRAIAAATAALIAVSAITMASAQAEHTARKAAAAEPLLCESSADVVTEFPYVMQLDDSDQYLDGPRSCSYYGKRRIVYQCDGDSADPATSLNVVDNITRERKLISVRCDGQRRVAEPAAAYGNWSGPYHVHWHIPLLGGWETAYLEIS